MAWPLISSQKGLAGVPMRRKGVGALPNYLIPKRLSYAEDALRSFSLPEEIVLNLLHALQQI
ncbi:hypothetical protein BVRB_7g178380 [Beta vulgaris subsp. vulgaris]|nr:hypothetical protein BVRB_7g178380 [Beta vulgaris subsp. vulgaris]